MLTETHGNTRKSLIVVLLLSIKDFNEASTVGYVK